MFSFLFCFIVESGETGGLSGGATAGIIITCLVVTGGTAGGYFIYKRRWMYLSCYI